MTNRLRRNSNSVCILMKTALNILTCAAILMCPSRAGAAEATGQITSLRLAIQDLTHTYGARYASGGTYTARLIDLEQRMAASGTSQELTAALAQLCSDALLANPLLDFERLLVVQRDSNKLGLPQNWEGNSSLPRNGFNNHIAVLSPVRPDGELRHLFSPEGGRFVGDVDVDFDAKKLLFSMPGDNGRWQVFEMGTDGGTPQQLPLIHEPDVDNYDACYLPDGNIIFGSTAPFTGVPCVAGTSHVANLYRLERATKAIRRLTFDQDHNWCPTVLNDGRLLYLRWEYADIPHFAARILFHMNPDGTDQKEYYGSGSYWPNAMFYARPVPGSATKFAAVVGGHHGQPRMGELVLFDTAQGRCEADGALQRIPGRGKQVTPVIRDNLVDASWPKFLHPWPLSEKYFLVAAQPAADSKWGIYLADVFDNLVLVKDSPDACALLEPIPLRPATRPPVVPSKVLPNQNDATVSILDIYAGTGLPGVPRGTVKQLRVFTYHFAYHGMGGQTNRVGLDGPWDIKRILGTVPVEADGSAYFRVPANTPISVQPLDADGQALQLMRSWMTAMPGETLSCGGCHDRQNSTPPTTKGLALAKPPAAITPWYGPPRGFSFVREVQPVLDRFCVGCHDGTTETGRTAAPDLRNAPPVHPQAGNAGYNNATQFTPSYLALRCYVRGHTIESDMHVLTPCEYSADTTELIQMLRAGHHGVKPDAEAFDRLTTWIDLNTPAHGTWTEIVGAGKVTAQRDRRREMLKQYAQRDEDPEAISETSTTLAFEPPAKMPAQSTAVCSEVPGWPFDAAEARRRQTAAGQSTRQLDLGAGIKLDLLLIPQGEFLTGGSNGNAGATRTVVSQPFWIGRCEISNEQFARFDPSHDSRIERGDFLQFGETERGYPANGPKQPVVRVAWNAALAFCRWLSDKTGAMCGLPSEAQWEYACRAGSPTPLWFGDLDTDFSKSANLADHSLRVMPTFGWGLPSGAVPPWRPAIDSSNDKFRVAAPVGTFEPNAWGLCDMSGNVWEWTTGEFNSERKAVRGGSWSDRPKQATSTSRLGYRPWQRVYNVGFRIMVADKTSATTKVPP
jgi:formylglycine-generating enzyme required for sulfatase activity